MFARRTRESRKINQDGVSFLIPVFNKAPWLSEVIDSIANQTGTFNKEYIFVDDGSTDHSLEIIKRKTAQWENVTIYHQQNKGSANATNQGIALAQMEYIKFVDADDILAHGATETLLDALKASPACLAYGDVVTFNDSSQINLDSCSRDATTELLPSPIRMAIRNSLFNPTQFIVRTELVRAVGGCDERVVHSQEYSLTLRLAHKWSFLKMNTPVAFIPRHVPGRLGGNTGQQLKRVSLTCAYFISDHPDLPYFIKQFACRRIAGRAWRYARRERKAGINSTWFWHYLRSRLPFYGGQACFIKKCAKVFD